MRRSPLRRASRGFTLIELMVALSIMALLALLSWRGLDAMIRAQQVTQAQGERLTLLQTALAQWRSDLDAMLPVSAQQAQPVLAWNGRALRVLRLAPASDSLVAQGDSSLLLPAGSQVVAWSLRSQCASLGATPCWIRWQSPVLRTVGEQQQAWQQAARWTEGQEQLPGEQELVPLTNWKLLHFRDANWRPASEQELPLAGEQALASMPDAIRLELQLPDTDSALHGTLTMDWIPATLTRRRS